MGMSCMGIWCKQIGKQGFYFSNFNELVFKENVFTKYNCECIYFATRLYNCEVLSNAIRDQKR